MTDDKESKQKSILPGLPPLPEIPTSDDLALEPVQIVGVILGAVAGAVSSTITIVVSTIMNKPEITQDINKMFRSAPQILPVDYNEDEDEE